MQHMTLEQFRATQDSGGVLSVTLMADGPGFEVQIETRRGMATLVKTRDKACTRRFVDPRKAMLLLRDMGIREARINGQDWRPEEPQLERKARPDRATAMRAAHEALSHTDWLHDKLEKSASDTRPRVPHTEAMARVQAIIDAKVRAHADKSTD